MIHNIVPYPLVTTIIFVECDTSAQRAYPTTAMAQALWNRIIQAWNLVNEVFYSQPHDDIDENNIEKTWSSPIAGVFRPTVGIGERAILVFDNMWKDERYALMSRWAHDRTCLPDFWHVKNVDPDDIWSKVQGEFDVELEKKNWNP